MQPSPRLAAAGLAALVAAVVLWQCRGRGSSTPSPPATTATSAARPTVVATSHARTRPDPARLARGSIEGTITADETRAPIAGARVCARGRASDLPTELLRELRCVLAGTDGRYRIDDLLPARYEISASARTYRPARHHPDGDRRRPALVLAAGARARGVDITLRPGGVEVTGTVADITGGPIARAQVTVGDRDQLSVATDTDEHGAFTLWVGAGKTYVTAAADGYADSSARTEAPGKVELLLTPASTLAGIVIDAASGLPVEGARVTSSEWRGAEVTFTDAGGGFRLSRHPPGRIVVIARTDRGYGRTEGSTLVGLGQHVDGVVVKLYPAVRIEGAVQLAGSPQPCVDAVVTLSDTAASREVAMVSEPDGRLWADGVLPGTYTPLVRCAGHQARDRYAPVVVTDGELTGLVWEVDPGAVIRGKVVSRRGEPLEDVHVWGRTTGGAARAQTGHGSDTSRRDGSYELTGLRPGSYKLELGTRLGIAPEDGFRVEVAAGATVERDLVLDAAGSIKGTVVDADGRPVGGVDITAQLTDGSGRGWGTTLADDRGAFTIEGLRPGEYRVTAQRGWIDQLKKPGTTDDAVQGEKVGVRAGQVATTRLVVEAPAGTITGIVIDATGAPIGDAFVSAARESDAAGASRSSVQDTRWSWSDRPVITDIDGTFTVAKLAPGAYTVRAYRRGGGEAVAEHVPIGGTARLQITPTGSLEGVVRRAGSAPRPITELELSVEDVQTGFSRDETFYMTAGRFAIHDLPSGSFRITAESAGARAMVEVDLAEGERKTGVAIELEALRTLTGRVVDRTTGAPVPGVRMIASPIAGAGGWKWRSDDDANITDEQGAFTIAHAPAGKLLIQGMPRDWLDGEYEALTVIRTPTGSDLGTLPMLRKRVKQGDPVGQLGVNFAEAPPGIPEDERIYKVSWIDPAGPAATTELAVGDIVSTIDGVDITGASSYQAWSMLRAPPGTRLVLGLVGGKTVTVTLASP